MTLRTRTREWRRRRAVQRVEPGTGKPLKRLRWWHQLSKTQFSLALPDDPGPDGTGRHVRFTVEVNHWQEGEDGRGRAHLYRDGVHHAVSRLPAAFPVPGGVVEVEKTSFGLKRCHYLAHDGTERQLTPDPRSAEGRRMRFDREHPGVSRVIGAFTAVLLVVPLALLALQLAEAVTGVPPVADRFGTFTSPVDLPTWANLTLTLVAAAASTERALRLRYSRLLDGS